MKLNDLILSKINEAVNGKQKLNQDRVEGLDYFYSKSKGDKHPINVRQLPKTQDAVDAKMKRIELSLVKVGMPGKAGELTRLANGMKEYLELKEQFEEKKEKLHELVPALFDACDAAFTRVVETAGVIISYSKQTTRSTVDSKALILFLKEAGIAADIVDECVEKATKISNVASSIKVELKEAVDDKQDGFFKKLWKKVSSWWNSFVSFVSRKLDRMANIDAQIKDILADNK